MLRSGEWLVRGRIDAVYRDGPRPPRDRVELVDWKTGRATDQAAGGLDSSRSTPSRSGSWAGSPTAGCG